MSPFVKKLVVSVIYALGPAWAVVELALPGGITGEEWINIVGAFAVAFYGTFKSNTTVLRPARPGEAVTYAGPGMEARIRR